MEIPKRALDLLQGGRSFLLAGHKGPDGDCLGSLVAFLGLVRDLGGRGTILLEKEPPSWFDFLEGLGEALLWERERSLPPGEVLVLLDCHEFSRTGGPGAALEKRGGPLLVLDHHAGRPVFPASFDAVTFLDPGAAATALLVLDLYRALGKVPSPASADGLLTGILTDTYWLQNSNTDGRVLEALSFLFRECSPSLSTFRVYDLVFRRYPEGTGRLMGAALSRLELHGPGGYLALVTLGRGEIESAGFDQFESEILSRPLLSMGPVRVGAVLYEIERGRVKFSLRSKGGGEALGLARLLGGGGHPEAAGAELEGGLAEARKRLLQAWRNLG